MPGNEIRKQSLRYKLNPIESVLAGRKVLLVDDSIVRGNTARAIIQMVRDAGAKSVIFASYSAPLTHPCVYGIDMQTRGEFIATRAGARKVAKKIGADHVVYQDKQDMEEAIAGENPDITHFCMACFDGCYPTEDVSRSMLKAIERERKSSQNCS
jgi:amidophosphoribosyltransferase